MDNASHKPLVVKGVRQCGKTSSVVDFARRHFRHVVYLDFREHPDYKKFFTPNLELDFLMRYQGQCTPVECKATTGNAKSMSTVLKHPEKHYVASALKLGDYNVGRSDQLLTLPMYMAFLLTEV